MLATVECRVHTSPARTQIRPLYAAALSDRIAPVDRDSGTSKLEQRRPSNDCD